MGGRSGSTARGRWSFFRHSHLLCVWRCLVQLRSLHRRGGLSLAGPHVGASFPHSLSKCLLVLYLVPDTVLDAGKERDRHLCLCV